MVETGEVLDVRAMLASQASNSGRPSIEVEKEDDLTYDLGRLYAYDPSPLPKEELASDPSAFLLRTARDNLQLLVNKLYGLLPSSGKRGTIELPPPTTPLPREKPLPEAKPLTRWERFAKDKGIVKKKRSKMVWDEVKQQWAPRFGFGRANNPKDTVQDWLVVAKPGDDGKADPFEAKSEERKMRLTKQKKQEERNRLEATHASSASMLKSDRKSYLAQSIAAAQVSTASVGRFDRAIANEPSKSRGKRKQYETATDKDATTKDSARAKKVVAKMFPENKAIAVDRDQVSASVGGGMRSLRLLCPWDMEGWERLGWLGERWGWHRWAGIGELG